MDVATDTGRAAVQAAVARPFREMPGPPARHAFRNIRDLRRDPFALSKQFVARYGDIVGFHFGRIKSVLIQHPAHLQWVLQENNQNYTKGEIVSRAKVLIGEGLFSSEGAAWRRQRRLMQPLFVRSALDRLVEPMVDGIAARIDRFERFAQEGRTVDLADEMTALTLTVVGRALFGLDLEAEAPTVGRSLTEALDYVNRRVTSLAMLPLAVPTVRSLRFRRARNELNGVVHRMIEQRRRSGERGSDLLSLMLDARDADSGEAMSARQVRDETMTFVLAGHETTAMALTWSWYLLTRHPHVDAALREELECVLGGRTPGVDDLSRLDLTRRIVQEAMRLYPPLWGFARQAVGSDVIGGYLIPPRTFISLIPYLTHRNAEFWPDPERFDPDRFTPERCKERPRFAYLPFSAGPRQCIGNEFALIEAQLALAMMRQRFRVETVDEGDIEASATVTTRPRVPIRVRLHAV